MRVRVQFDIDIPERSAERVRGARRHTRKIQLNGHQREGIVGLLTAPGHSSTEDGTLEDIEIIEIPER